MRDKKTVVDAPYQALATLGYRNMPLLHLLTRYCTDKIKDQCRKMNPHPRPQAPECHLKGRTTGCPIR